MIIPAFLAHRSDQFRALAPFDALFDDVDVDAATGAHDAERIDAGIRGVESDIQQIILIIIWRIIVAVGRRAVAKWNARALETRKSPDTI